MSERSEQKDEFEYYETFEAVAGPLDGKRIKVPLKSFDWPMSFPDRVKSDRRHFYELAKRGKRLILLYDGFQDTRKPFREGGGCHRGF